MPAEEGCENDATDGDDGQGFGSKSGVLDLGSCARTLVAAGLRVLLHDGVGERRLICIGIISEYG